MIHLDIERINRDFRGLLTDSNYASRVHDAWQEAWQEAALEIPEELEGIPVNWDEYRVWFEVADTEDETFTELADETAIKIADEFMNLVREKLTALDKERDAEINERDN